MEYDLIVIGAGSGGVRASRLASAAGHKVLVVESGRYGGTCVNVGCIPKKLFSYAAKYMSDSQVSSDYGYTNNMAFDWQSFKTNRDNEIRRLNQIYVNILDNNKVTRVDGAASFIDQNTISVTDIAGNKKQYKAQRILIASGSTAQPLELPGAEYCCNSDDIFAMQEQPKSIIILGSGYIAVELACILALLGTKTTLIYRANHVLRGFDLSIRQSIEAEMLENGITLLPEHGLKTISKTNSESESDHITVHTTDHAISAQHCLMATGRTANIEGLNLAAAGVELTPKRSIKINTNYQTTTASIFALGDVTDSPQLTPVAIAQAKQFVAHISDAPVPPIDMVNIPTAVFTLPEIGTIGLSQEQALQQHGQCWVYETRFRNLKYSLTTAQHFTHIKVITKDEEGEILGVHLMGESAGEIIQVIGVWFQTGTTLEQVRRTVPVHPTWAEEIVTLPAGKLISASD